MATFVLSSGLMDFITPKNVLCLAFSLVVIKHSDDLLWLLNSWRSPLRHLPGPKSDSPFFGNLLTLLRGTNTYLWEDWFEKYGKTIRYWGFFGSYQLLTIDMRAMNYIMSHSSTFFKAERNRQGLARILGQGETGIIHNFQVAHYEVGLLAADYETHKRQRRVMNPAFGQPQIRELVPIFCEKANQLRDILLDQMSNNLEGTTIDVLQWLSYATLDIIGVAGFGYEFNSLRDGDEDALAKAFSKVFDTDEDDTLSEKLKGLAARLLGMPTEKNLLLRANIETMNRIGAKIVADKKALLLQEQKDGTTFKDRDILSLLIKSNMAQETGGVKEDQSMSDTEVLGQISTFLAAGHETTSTSTTWTLYALSKHPRVQSKLREELQSAQLGDEPSMAELEKLPYLDNVVREAFRVFPAVPVISRQATEDAVIPVGQGYKDRYGVTQNEIRIQKWDTLRISILAINRAKDVWGEDAWEFRPERWDNLPPMVKDMPGVYGNLMTFIHGHHACIGYRFALVETKALLYSLVRSIEFDIDPKIEIIGKTGIVTRPCVKSQAGNRMPLICKPATGLNNRSDVEEGKDHSPTHKMARVVINFPHLDVTMGIFANPYTNSATIALSYLVEGDNPRTSALLVEISPNEYINELADAIQTDYEADQIHDGIIVSEDSLLPFDDMVSDYWSSDLPRIPGMVHILVRASTVERDTRPARASAVPILPSLTSTALTPGGLAKRLAVLSLTQEKTVQAINSGPTSSVVARVPEFNDQQHRSDAPIHNGRPEQYGTPSHCCAGYIYLAKLDRISAIRGKLEKLLHASFTLEEIGGCKASGVIKGSLDDTHDHETAYTVIMEVKNEIGTDDSDPSVQGAESYARYWSNNTMKHIRNVSCCPSFVVAVAGPWICILGAVFVEKVIVHPLTDFLWMGRESHDEDRLCSLTRTFCALRQSIQGLNEYYLSLRKRPDEDLQRFFPYIRQFPAQDNQTVSFSYSAILAVNPVRPVFLATTDSRQYIVVKFVRHYNSVAHRALAAKDLAPKLLYDSEERQECGMRMIVMEYVPAKNLHDYLFQKPQDDCEAAKLSIKTDLTAALQIVHEEGLVFGDLRKPNVLVVEKGTRVGAMLIDFDWCSQHQTGRYPLGLNDAGITWADGVKRGGAMDQKHDNGMLELLFE
ncbi:hypothetical protein FRC10_003848 [Ceratobasidium sp. 414]|nr:hypothetical protein FRC10_003848 [Ceratobasidium sp. 414]